MNIRIIFSLISTKSKRVSIAWNPKIIQIYFKQWIGVTYEFDRRQISWCLWWQQGTMADPSAWLDAKLHNHLGYVCHWKYLLETLCLWLGKITVFVYYSIRICSIARHLLHPKHIKVDIHIPTICNRWLYVLSSQGEYYAHKYNGNKFKFI